MKVGKKIRYLAVILLSLIASLESAYALPVPTFRFAFGKSMLNITAGVEGDYFFEPGTPVKSSITLNPSFLWDIPSLRSRVGAQFLLDVGSPYGFLTAAGIGATVFFYPMGLSSGREKRDDDVEFVKTRFSPYIHAAFTPTKVSYTKPPNPAAGTSNQPSFQTQQYFSAIVMETELGVGVDYPITDDFVIFLGIDYRFAAFTAQENTIGPVKYNGPAVMLGVMTNFY